MLSPRSILDEIFDSDEEFELFCSIAASDESQGGWENSGTRRWRPVRARPAPKIAAQRHEDKHGRIFTRRCESAAAAGGRLRGYGLHGAVEHSGIGLAHARLRQEKPLTEQDIVIYLAHSRVTEQRASEHMRTLRRYVGSRPDVGRAIRMI